jgi:hypothetical protein
VIEIVSLIVSFAVVIVAIRRLGAGADLALSSLFPTTGQSEWPRGVQEEDVPRFVFHSAA